MKLNISMEVEIVEHLKHKDTIATIYYPNEGNKIKIKNGLNTIQISEAIFHEIGHLIDWYLSEGKQSKKKNIRENIADYIGETLRFKKWADKIIIMNNPIKWEKKSKDGKYTLICIEPNGAQITGNKKLEKIFTDIKIIVKEKNNGIFRKWRYGKSWFF